MRYRVIPYRNGSRGASELAQALGGLCLRLNGSRFQRRPTDRIINWGNTEPLFTDGVLNGRGIREASNKLRFFELIGRTNPDIIPRWWTRSEDIPADAYPIVCRTILAGHSGQGIVIANTRDDIVPAPLYVQYVKKQDEYRIHVGVERRLDGNAETVIDVQKKMRRREHEEPNYQIRNLANGFIYAREDVVAPEGVIEAAKTALGLTSLDFGAVDVIYNARQDRAYVLEVNTAPGITGTTTANYANYFRNY